MEIPERTNGMDAVAAKHVGARLLSEVEEGSLEEVCIVFLISGLKN